MNKKLFKQIIRAFSAVFVVIVAISSVSAFYMYQSSLEKNIENILNISAGDANILNSLENKYNIQSVSVDDVKNIITTSNNIDENYKNAIVSANKEDSSFKAKEIEDRFYLIGAIKTNNYIYVGRIYFDMAKILTIIAVISILELSALMLAYTFIFKQINVFVLEPVENLAKRLSFIAKGDYNIYLEYNKEHELSSLVSSINKLGENLSKTLKDLITEKKKFDYIMDNLITGVIVVDNNKTIAQLNNNAKIMLNLPVGVVGKSLENFSIAEKIANAVNKAIDDGTSSVFDLNLMEISGMITKVQVNGVKASWSGAESSAVVVMSNVTQNRQLERMRSEFVANASHELKTPITSIRGFAELLSQDVLTDENEKKRCLKRIETESQRMYNIIEDILRLAQLETQEQDKGIELISLNNICSEISENLLPVCETKGVSIALKGEASYLSNHNDMHQLIKNLMENAVKYNKEGGKVLIRLYQDNSAVKITISDTGIGIPAEDQGRIFERFYRVDKGRSKQEGGTGLGLSIVKHITLKYSGEMSLTSHIGIGTTIKIVLPVK